MNHAISALKFKIIREFLELGWNVLLSDVDVILVQVAFTQKSIRHPTCTIRPGCLPLQTVCPCIEASKGGTLMRKQHCTQLT